MQQRIVGFHQDEDEHWVAELECGHNQHVRHDPPWTKREWVTTVAGRNSRLGSRLDCKKCDTEHGRKRGTSMSDTRIREAIDNLSAAIAADPRKAPAKHSPARARLTEGLQCAIVGPNDEHLVTDMPPAMGGTAAGPNPGWLLRGALASCAAPVIAMR